MFQRKRQRLCVCVRAVIVCFRCRSESSVSDVHIPAREGLDIYRPDHTCEDPATTKEEPRAQVNTA